jgi:hypothetical protein
LWPVPEGLPRLIEGAARGKRAARLRAAEGCVMTKTAMIAHTDHGTVIRPDQAALIADVSGYSLLLPKSDDPDTPMPQAVQLLVAVATMIDDEDWVSEMISTLHGLR